MKGIFKRCASFWVAFVVLCCACIPAYAATSSSDYSVKVSGKSIYFIRAGKSYGPHTSRDGKVTISTAPSGTLALCYYTTANKYARVTLSNTDEVSITGTISSLTLDKSLASSSKVVIGSDADITDMKISSKNKVTIGGAVSTLTVSNSATVTVVSGATVTSAKVNSSYAKLTAATGSTVKKVTAASGALISGKGIKDTSYTDGSNSSSSGSTVKDVTLTARNGDTLRDISSDLNSKVKIYDDDGKRIIGTAEWDNSDSTEVRDGYTYDYTFYPDLSKYSTVSGTARVSTSGNNSSNSSSSNSDTTVLRLDTAAIYSRSSSAKLKDLDTYLNDAVVAYDYLDRIVSGRAEWISDTNTAVRSGQSYSVIFVPLDGTYDSARGMVKVELNSKSNGVGGGLITLAAFTLEANSRAYLSDLRSQLQDNVRAYNSSGTRVTGSARWVSSDVRLTTTGMYRYEFVPDNSRYETTTGDIKVFVSGSGSSGGTSSGGSSGGSSSNSSTTLTLKINDITVNGSNNSLRDLASDLYSAVTAKDSNGSTVDGKVQWVDSNTSQKVRSTGSYRFKFVPNSSSYDQKQDWITITVR